MSDIYHDFGADLTVSSTGDVLLASGIDESQQRILRRLLTNPGDYLFHPDYGAGLPGFIGQTINEDEVSAIIQGQILLEDAVASYPAPVVSVTAISGGLSCSIQYIDAGTQTPQALSFNVSV